jgi:hypothetical protein
MSITVLLRRPYPAESGRPEFRGNLVMAGAVMAGALLAA